MSLAARHQGRTKARTRDTWASAARLLGWLGPWGGERVPRSVRRTEIFVDRSGDPGSSEAWRRATSMRAYLYEPAGRPTGAYLVAQGLHYAGPDDPRLDRFCRVLAAGGHLVLAPFLPAFGAMIVDASAGDDLALAFDELERRALPLALPRPAVLSISFGSLPSASLATRPAHRDRVGGWLSFGGYLDFGATIRFALTGRYHHEGRPVAAAHDPLNAPVVFLNIVRHLDEATLAPDRHAAFGEALREVARRTWGKMELKRPGARDPFVESVVATLPLPERDLLRMACGLVPGAEDLVEAGLARAGAFFDFADPTSLLADVKAPVTVVHGREDDVIPWIEAHKLHSSLPKGRAEVFLTGLYGHTGAALPSPREAWSEATTLLRILDRMASAPRQQR
jgi:pimeloyl-ACP methyl ester carboxylesterase